MISLTLFEVTVVANENQVDCEFDSSDSEEIENSGLSDLVNWLIKVKVYWLITLGICRLFTKISKS